jgi:hypothetical protein
LKKEIYKRHPELILAPNTEATLNLLIQCAISTWDVIGVNLFNTFIDSMENRRQAVEDANGWYTKY